MCGESACLTTLHNEGPGFLFGGNLGCSPLGRSSPSFQRRVNSIGGGVGEEMHERVFHAHFGTLVSIIQKDIWIFTLGQEPDLVRAHESYRTRPESWL